jgi:hypothetical protein
MTQQGENRRINAEEKRGTTLIFGVFPRSFPRLSASIIFAFLFSVIFALPLRADAAEFKITTPKPTINTQQRVRIEVWLDGQGEAINAIEGKVVWPKDYFALESVSDANSIINFWLAKPSADAGGDLAFAGVIPGGYTESGGLLLSAVLQAKKNGEAVLSFKELKALIGDGQGTPAKVTTMPLKLSIASGTPLLLDFPNPDNERPEDFKPEISNSADLFDNQYFMVFATQDKGSGLDHYEVVESRRELAIRTIDPVLWVRAESPYLLKDQKLGSYIYIKAVDKAGNERLVSVAPIKPRFSLWPQLPQILFYGIIIAIIILGGIAIKSVKFNIVIRPKDHVKKEGKKLR